jgi:hypothetical protein
MKGRSGITPETAARRWIEGDELKGVIELSLVIPLEMPHYNRDKS